MATIRRLNPDDVKEIFDSLHKNNFPSEKLKFHIVVVGCNGMKLSPPSYEFQDGLYVLLRPLKKSEVESERLNRPQDDPRIPSNLKSLVFTERLEETCPWSLSGPQFPTPTPIQQRYCYPKGDPSYSTLKGGALWTYYDKNGKEDLQYRLLHVYYSAKRAGNKTPSNHLTVTPQRRTSTIDTASGNKKCKIEEQDLPLPSLNSPFNFPSISSTFSDSPLSFDMSVSPIRDNTFESLLSRTDSMDHEQVITPDRDLFESHYKNQKLQEKEKRDSSHRNHEKYELLSDRQAHFHPQHRYNYAHNSWADYNHHPYSFNYPPETRDAKDSSWSRDQLHHHNYYHNHPLPTQHVRQLPTTRRSRNMVLDFQKQLNQVECSLRESLRSMSSSNEAEGKEILKIWSKKLIKNLSEENEYRIAEL